jgi:hypothetical protein
MRRGTMGWSLILGFAMSAPSPALASFRHYSSRLVDGTKNESVYAFIPYGQPKLVAADENSNVFLIVAADSLVSFGATWVGPGTVVAALDRDGKELWSRLLFTSGSAIVTDVESTHDRGVVMTGQFSSAVNFGGGPMTPAGAEDIFVVKLDASGVVAWQRSYGDRRSQRGIALAVDTDDNIVVTGSNAGVTDFGDGPISSNGNDDIFVVKLDHAGQHLWSRGFGQIGFQEGLSVAVGPDGEVALATRLYAGGIDFGGGLITAVGNEDIVMAMLDASGAYRWSRLAATQQDERAVDVVVDTDGNATFCGWLSRSIDFGGGMVAPETSARQTGFVASYDASGAFRWVYLVQDSLFSACNSLGRDVEDNLYLLAEKRNATTIASEFLPASRFLLIAMSAGGQPLCAGAYGVPGTTTAFMCTSSDRAILAGSTGTDINLGGETLYPVTGTDIYVGAVGIRRPADVSIGAFTAHVKGDDVVLDWELVGSEPLKDAYVSRQRAGMPNGPIIYSAPVTEKTSSFVDTTPLPGNTYQYVLTVETSLGDAISRSTRVEVPALKTALAQNSPNPFNPLTTFSYTLASPAQVSIAIYDLSGALVAKLDQGMQPAGRHSAAWGGHNWQGSVVSSGVYFYRLEGAGDMAARKMILVK